MTSTARPISIRHIPNQSDAQKVFGSSGLQNLGGRIQEEYLTIIQDWNRAVDVFLEMRDDVTIATGLDAIKLPLLAADFDVQSASKSIADQRAADFLWDNMQKMDRQSWRSYVLDALEAIEFGWQLSEIVLERRRDGRLWLKNLDPRGQETLLRWQFDTNDRTTGFIQHDPYSAYGRGKSVLIPIDKTVHMTFRGRKGNPQGKALFRDLFRPWKFLKELENLEGIGLERNVGGMPVFKLPQEPLEEQDLTRLQNAARDMRMDEAASLILPYGVEVDTYAGGSGANFDPVINRKKKEILMRMFAQFLELGMESVGTQALVEGDQDFFSLSLIAIQQHWLETWNQQLVGFLFRFNQFPGMTGLPKITWNDPGKVDFAGILDAYVKGVGAQVITATREDEEHLRALGGFPDLPEGEGMGPRETEMPGMPMMARFQNFKDWDWQDVGYHLPGKHDQKEHGTPGKNFESAASADEWGLGNYSEWADGLSTEEVQSLREYKLSGFVPINTTLREGTTAGGSPEAAQVNIDNITAALDRSSVPEPITVYRTMPASALVDVEEGTIVTDRGFISTTLYREETPVRAGLVEAEILVPEGSRGAYIETVGNIGQRELLLQRNTQFRIVKRNNDRIQLEVVEQP